VPASSLGFVDLMFILLTQGEREASAPKKCVVGKADLDNLVKFVLDAMGGVAFADDQQISQLTCEKVWDVGDGSTTCTLTQLEEQDGGLLSNANSSSMSEHSRLTTRLCIFTSKLV
jgi:hypothetical protein